MVITSPWALHVGVPDRFNRPTSIGLGVTADNTSLTFTAVDVTFSGSSANAIFAGIDTKNVEYVASDRGRVAGINIPYIANQLNGTFASSEQGSFSLAGDTAQCSQPSFEIAGTVTSTRPAIRPNPPRTERMAVMLTEGSKNRRKHNEKNAC